MFSYSIERIRTCSFHSTFKKRGYNSPIFSSKIYLSMKFILQTTRKMGFLAFILGVCLFSVQTVFSQTVTKTSTGTGDWSVAGTWTPSGVPGATDVVSVLAGHTITISSGTIDCKKITITGSGTSSTTQGKVIVSSGATLRITADATVLNGTLTLNAGIMENNGTLTVKGGQAIDAIRFGNPVTGTTVAGTYFGTGNLTCDNSAAIGSGTSGNNGAGVVLAQSQGGPATFTTNSGSTYTFTLFDASKSAFYNNRGNALINGDGAISISGVARSFRVFPAAANEKPSLTIESGVTLNLSTTITTSLIGMILIDASTQTGATVNMTNKGTINFTGANVNPIYMNNSATAITTTNFKNEGTININGDLSNSSAEGGIYMAGSANTNGHGNVFNNSGTITFNTASATTKPLFYCTSGPINLITNSGPITVGTTGAPTLAFRLGEEKTTVNNTGTITLGAGSISGGSVANPAINANFNNNTNGILNLNSGINSSLVIFTNAGGTFNVPITQRVGRLTVDGGTVAIADGATFTVSTLTLTSGNIPLGTGNITIENGGSIVGGSLASHIITNGTGKLTQQVTSVGKLFPIGQSASSYDPVVIKPAAVLNFGARVGLQTSVLGTNPVNPSLVVNREWDITGTAGTTDLSFTSLALNKDGSMTRPAAGVGIVGHYNSVTSAWDDFPAVYNSMLNTWGIAGYSGSFSPFIVASPGAVLSTELLNIKAKAVNNANILTWETASETNNKGFEVERQNANGTWASLGFVQGIGKAATYTFEDKGPLSISYYRLRQIDFDGKETLSKVVSVSQNTKGRISISPNPTSDKVNINLNQNDVSNQPTTVILSDMTGRQVMTQTTTSGAFQLDLSNLAKGMYVITLQSNNAIYQEKIVRQ
jgi:Secretion system C-terminal sorting domain